MLYGVCIQCTISILQKLPNPHLEPFCTTCLVLWAYPPPPGRATFGQPRWWPLGGLQGWLCRPREHKEMPQGTQCPVAKRHCPKASAVGGQDREHVEPPDRASERSTKQWQSVSECRGQSKHPHPPEGENPLPRGREYGSVGSNNSTPPAPLGGRGKGQLAGAAGHIGSRGTTAGTGGPTRPSGLRSFFTPRMNSWQPYPLVAQPAGEKGGSPPPPSSRRGGQHVS